MANQKIEAPNSPWLIFRYAEAFRKSAEERQKQLREPHTATGHGNTSMDSVLRVPFVVMDAFSLELYLKCLQVIEKGSADRGHKCKRLFASLSPGMRDSVRALYVQILRKESRLVGRLHRDRPEVKTDIDSILDLSNDVFENVRYLYEGNKPTMFYWPLLAMAVRSTILAINPDWKE